MIKWRLYIDGQRIEFSTSDEAHTYRKEIGFGNEVIEIVEENLEINTTFDHNDKYAKRSEFGVFLMNKVARQNETNNINLEQANWFIGRVKGITLTTGDVINEVNILVLFSRGMLETTYVAISQMTPDDFTQPYHWVTQDLIDQMAGDILNYLTNES